MLICALAFNELHDGASYSFSLGSQLRSH
jgi:hypothetical protein